MAADKQWTIVIEAKSCVHEGLKVYMPEVVSYDGPEDSRGLAVKLAVDEWRNDMERRGAATV